MKNSRFIRTTITLIAAIGLSVGLTWHPPDVRAGMSAQAIMEKVAETRKLSGSEAVVKMSVSNGKGQTRERKISIATKLFDGGKTEKRIYRFLAPADVKGTGVLVYDYESKADDVWVFLPAMRKTRRIVSSQRSKSFMGSEFTYGDLNFPSLSDYEFKLVKEENAGGEACYVIDMMPKSDAVAKAEGYKKKTYWVSKAKFAVRKGLYYDMSGKLLKEFTSSDIKLLDPKLKRYRAMHMEMTNKQNGRKSVFTSEKVAVAPNTKDEYFTTRYLERQ